MQYFGAMKAWMVFLVVCIGLVACGEAGRDEQKPVFEDIARQPAGLVIAADSMPIARQDLSAVQITRPVDDTACLSVAITTTAYTHKGRYQISTSWAGIEHITQLTMPRGAEDAVPELVRGDEPYTYIIRFRYGAVDTFYDYYRIAGSQAGIDAKYIKAYVFE